MKQMLVKQQLITRKQWGKLLMGILVIFVSMQLVARVGIPQLQRFIASGAPNPPSQTNAVTEKVEADKKLQ
ncbi:hypothetical protein KBC80_05410 [Candidatus Woesebacteria bacterium]|nr:hypothetical protein [Candidatus Woesebacteria bacterium]